MNMQQNQQKERPRIQCGNCGHSAPYSPGPDGARVYCNKISFVKPANQTPNCLFSISKADNLRKLGLL